MGRRGIPYNGFPRTGRLIRGEYVFKNRPASAKVADTLAICGGLCDNRMGNHHAAKRERELPVKVLKRTFWLLGFLPAVIGAFLIWHIKHNMQMVDMLTDYLVIIAIGVFAVIFTIIAVPSLLVLSLYLCRKDRVPPPLNRP